ncbi:hypothetical protein K443DRAFT_632628 [Laccaria amethystina LaAM-08-1]|uniref:Uncharacterized protein n=1 Tax=Laccaria amethystina LaAM-08-1 TaxID=1095629 RepID=A0A0C9XHI6_9AGAR|nr:hypothetical protein K443DRAFT_632628 [Laccaria amethystina LaAM-08-1]
MTVQPPHGDMDANAQRFPKSVTSSLLTVTWMPTLPGSCPGARPKPPQLPREKGKKERKRNYPEGVWLSSLLTVTWVPALNGFRRNVTSSLLTVT